MIKLQRPNTKYATTVDVVSEVIEDPGMMKYLKKESIRKLKVPKNTLRIMFKDKFTGWNGDGFARNIKTVRFTYNIITFKR